MEQISVLKGLVCGFERSGTTLVSQLLRQHPWIDTGFEVGALLDDSPEAFLSGGNPWVDTGLFEAGWRLDPKTLSGSTFAEFYEDLQRKSPVVKNKNGWLIDKTPRYQEQLTRILDQFDLPVIVVIKDPVVLWASWKKRGMQLDDFFGYYSNRMAVTNAAERLHPNRVLVVKYEMITSHPEPWADACFRHFELVPFYGWHEDGSVMVNSNWQSTSFGVSGVRGDRIVGDADENLKTVSNSERQEILNRLGEYAYFAG